MSYSITHNAMNNLPELTQYMLSKGAPLGINIVYSRETNHYRVCQGNSVNGAFEQIGESPFQEIGNLTVNQIIDSELKPFGDGTAYFDVFVNGKLSRKATRTQ